MRRMARKFSLRRAPPPWRIRAIASNALIKLFDGGSLRREASAVVEHLRAEALMDERDLRCSPETGQCPFSATKRLMHRSKQHGYSSITVSALVSSAGGTMRPSALAVLRLITNSYLTGAWTGSSLGFSPLRMRST